VEKDLGVSGDFLLPESEVPSVLVTCLLISRSPNRFHT
jgi:hypothetical protein